jgi:hypothetical protein
MTVRPPFALSFTDPGLLEKTLVVLGSALAGGFLVGLLLQYLVKTMSAQKVPRRILWVIRLLGGVTAGWLVLWFMGAGGWGWGGGGGSDVGSGRGGNQSATQQQGEHTGTGSGGDATVGAVLRVEVLTNRTVQRLAGPEAVAAGKFYHVLKTDEKALLTLDEMKQEIRKRATGKPALKRLDIVEAPDNPTSVDSRVTDLTNWAKEQGLTVAYTKP